ncbi:MAG: DNA-directed RNA polymerase subunit L [Candidatus Diapherotrites archaeon]|nr:DNA-directed RNA polymerase subunit L [Candidatus Micrarchaeota archaeon]MBU1939900.1 DNA-directed RNA polymerase subunit L [Candidatus Micrarchaeota archaeon]
MEIEVLNKQGNLLEFFIKGERHTFPNLLKSALLKEPGVEFVSYVLDHPLDSKAKFILRTKGKTPKIVLASACGKIEKDLAEFQNAIKTAVK